MEDYKKGFDESLASLYFTEEELQQIEENRKLWEQYRKDIDPRDFDDSYDKDMPFLMSL